MIKIIADNKIPYLKGALEGVAQVEYFPGMEITRNHLMDAQALIIRTRTRCNEALLKGTPVKFIGTASIGYDHIDTAYCRSHGIRWVNAPGCNANSVKQYIASTLAYIFKKKGASFNDLTLGIIGAGHVGSRVEVMASILGIPCIKNDPPRAKTENPEEFVSLEELLSRSDIVSLHVPLNTFGIYKTFQMADLDFFGKMKKGAWFINTSRGEVHNTKVLLNALVSGQLGGAVIDTWENEPAINYELLKAADIATPHIAGYSQDGKASATTLCVQAISRFFDLGINDWRPESIPSPDDPNIVVSCEKKSTEEIFQYLAYRIYDIEKDSDSLKNSPARFELFRENYPIRRESKAYTVELQNCSPEIKLIVRKLGFK